MSNDERETETYVTETKYNKKTGLPISRRTHLNGLLHAPPNDEPSEIIYDQLGRPKYIRWHAEDRPHRVNAPAKVDLNPENGQHWVECFFLEGEPLNPRLGPYRIVRHPETGEVIKQVRFGDPEFPEEEPDAPVEPNL